MKIRTDYVTNSSSSSFILSYYTTDCFDKDTLVKYPFLKYYTEIIEDMFPNEYEHFGYMEDTDKIIISDKDDLKNLISYYIWQEDGESFTKALNKNKKIKALYNKLLKELKAGKKVVRLTFDNNSEKIEDFKEMAQKGIISYIEEIY